MNEFSHTMLHDQHIFSNDMKLENIKHIMNEGPVPPHLLKAHIQKEQQIQNQLQQQQHHVLLPCAEQSPGSHRQLLPLPNGPQKVLRSPLLQPVMAHHKKSPSSSPMVTGNHLYSHDPNKQIKSPSSAIRQLPPISRPSLPPIFSPQLQAEHRSPALGIIRPLMERDLHAQERIDPAFRVSRESPQSNLLRPLPNSDRKHVTDGHNFENRSPQVQLPSLMGQSPSPNVQGRLGQLKPLDCQGLPQINQVRRSAEKPGIATTKVGVKREMLKGFDKATAGGFGEPKGLHSSNKKEMKSPNHIEENVETEVKEKNGNKYNMFYKDLLKEVKEKDSNKENHSPPENGAEKVPVKVKNHVQEVKDIEAMVLELNKIVSNLGSDPESNGGTPLHKNSIDEEFSEDEEDHKDEDREDDLDESHPAEKEENNNKKEKENHAFPNLKSMQGLKAKLEEELGQDRFKKTYEQVREMMDNDEEVYPSEEKIEHYTKLFPFLSKEEINSQLFSVFTYAVMNDWFEKKSLKV